ncbi:SWIM zinc finger family protein [Wolbachia endosymbiont of Folsomia candida]|uniref:SWIM zinc finger family protein n=1 Tax=Wolbachia endosymbiont of Folsomia candida TaxID=169402 RepID=UPI000B17F700|nr:hypothetical protein [Wolbachia endosymbiont of Folsomia candida]
MRLNYKDIRDFIKESYITKGRGYFDDGMVQIVSVNESHAESNVTGSSVYQVTLKHNGQYLTGKCSCPALGYCGPCKHMAATCFALIQLDRQEYRSSLEYVDEQDRLEKLLIKKTKQELIPIIVRFSDRHPEILEELEDEEYEEYRLCHSK